MKNNKKIFFVLTLLALLILTTAVNATDNADNTMITDDAQTT